VSEDGSIGIDAGSLVDSVKELMERIHYITRNSTAPRSLRSTSKAAKFYASIFGNENPEVLPLIELDLFQTAQGYPRIACQDVKFDHETEAYKVTKSAPAKTSMMTPRKSFRTPGSPPGAPSACATTAASTCA